MQDKKWLLSRNKLETQVFDCQLVLVKTETKKTQL